MLNNVELKYKLLKNFADKSLSRLSVLVYKETSSVDVGSLVLISKSFFLWIQCPKILLIPFKDGADLRMDSFSCKQNLHTLSFGANGFTFLTIPPLDIEVDVLVFF